jgi:Iap family predicted aminopeptidase
MTTSHIDWQAADRELILDSMLAGRAYSYAAALCEVAEHRFAGSPGDRVAVTYMQNAMAEIGLSGIRAEPFPITAWERGRTELAMLTPQRRRLDALALVYTSSGVIEGELVDVGYGTEEEFAAIGAAVRGRLVLARSDAPAWLRRGMYRGEKVLRAQTYGAVGIIIANAALGLLPLAGSLGFSGDTTLPAVTVSYETGEALRRRLQVDGIVRLRLEMGHHTWPETTHNVVGELAGRAWPTRYLLVGAHYDSHDLCEGARDDAGGVGITLEIARLLAGSPIGVGRTVRFIAFGAEELGLLGAEAYATAHAAELDAFDLMLNLDCAGRPGPKDFCVNHWPALRELLKGATGDIADLGYADGPPSMHMDHFQFYLRGVPTATLAGVNRSGSDPKDAYHHTAADTLDKLTAEDLQAEALRAARALLRLSWAWPWPAARRSTEDVRQLLKAGGMDEGLAAEGRFPLGK